MSNIFQLILKEYTKFGIQIWTANKEIEFWRRIVFLYSSTNSSSGVPAILTSLTHHCCINNSRQWWIVKQIKFLLQFCVKRGYGAKKILPKSSQTKTGLCHLWRRCWSRLIKPVSWIANPTVVKEYDSNKQICASVSCHRAMENITQNTQFHPCGFPMKFYLLCSVNEPSEWSRRNCCVVNFIFSEMAFKSS